MKTSHSLIFAAIGLLQTSAFAFPTVGDFAQYSHTAVQANSTQSYVEKKEVLAIDRAADQMTVKSSTFLGSIETDVETINESLSEMLSLYQFINQCLSMGGSAEIQAAAQQSFQTCRMTQSIEMEDEGSGTATVWFAKVPFGVVRSRLEMKTPDGPLVQEMVLSSFRDQ